MILWLCMSWVWPLDNVHVSTIYMYNAQHSWGQAFRYCRAILVSTILWRRILILALLGHYEAFYEFFVFRTPLSKSQLNLVKSLVCTKVLKFQIIGDFIKNLALMCRAATHHASCCLFAIVCRFKMPLDTTWCVWVHADIDLKTSMLSSCRFWWVWVTSFWRFYNYLLAISSSFVLRFWSVVGILHPVFVYIW